MTQLNNLQFVKGNLLDLAEDGKFDIVVQGCNCFNTMGSGLARQIRNYYPNAFKADSLTVPGDKNKLGTYTLAYANSGFLIINAYTQYSFNKAGTSTDLFEYNAFLKILTQLAQTVENNPKNFGFPLIGCGLAGGNKEIILKMLDVFAFIVGKTGSTVTVVEYTS